MTKMNGRDKGERTRRNFLMNSLSATFGFWFEIGSAVCAERAKRKFPFRNIDYHRIGRRSLSMKMSIAKRASPSSNTNSGFEFSFGSVEIR